MVRKPQRRKTRIQQIFYHIWQFMLGLMVSLAIAGLIAWDPVGRNLGGQGMPTEQQNPEINLPTASLDEVPSIFTGSISGIDRDGQPFSDRSVQYLVVDGYAVHEGDILLQLGTGTQAGLVVSRSGLRWTDGIIPYEIAPNLRLPDRVAQAIAHWESETPLRFVRREASNAAQYPNYLVFQHGGGCASFVGMIGGAQPVYLAPACSVGNTIHEIGHAVGLWHEQSRNDRDQYVVIHYENIARGYEFNFDKAGSAGQDSGLYDYDSIMHYPRWAFSRNGQDTITPLQDRPIGQRDTLSPGDIAAIERLYAGIAEP